MESQLNENYVIIEYNINKEKLNELIQLLNCYEEARKDDSFLKGI